MPVVFFYLDCGTIGDRVVGADALAGFFTAKVGREHLLNLGYARRSAHGDQVAHSLAGDPSILRAKFLDSKIVEQ